MKKIYFALSVLISRVHVWISWSNVFLIMLFFLGWGGNSC